MEPAPGNVTRLLKAAGDGDQQAEADLLRAVYAELRQMAQAWMARTPPGQTLQPTALVHEAFVRLVGRDTEGWENRAHFFFAAGRAMRDILVEQARRKGTLKRGGDQQRVDVPLENLSDDPVMSDVLALNEALARLEQLDPRKAELVMLRHFAGLTMEETAAAMGVSLSTVEREWRFTRALLYSQIVADDSQS